MLVDAETLDAGRTIHADLCLIGAGAAGITIARRLIPQGWNVCLLESGGFDLEPSVQSLYEGEVEATTPSASSAYLIRSRLRYFGGSTNHWTGYCRPLDEIDFAVRSWVPDSGWPLAKSALAPYYAEAADVVEVPRFDNERDEGVDWDPDTVVADTGDFLTKQFHLSPPTRFARSYRAGLASAAHVRTYLHANVVGIVTSEAGNLVDRVRISTMSGKQHDVRARQYVLAAGGIENARLLLNADGLRQVGIGNDQDLVGRFFMEHPHVYNAGDLILASPLTSPDTYGRHGARRPVLCPSPELQRAHGLLNSSVMLNFDMSQAEPVSVRRVSNAVFGLELGTDRRPQPPVWSGCYVRAEQAPNSDSRVMLSEERDSLGMRRTRLDWRMTSVDIDNIRRTMELLGRVLGRTGRGRVRHAIDHLDPWGSVRAGDHHMGTTRMGVSAATSVVDANCRVHGMANLHVAGSSVFPTVGFANPTLTVVALALRLADHLNVELGDA